MHFVQLAAIMIAATSKLAVGAYAQQPLSAESVPEPEEDPREMLFKHITMELNGGQFCPDSPTPVALWSKGRAVTFIEGASYARNNTGPAEFVISRASKDRNTVTISHIDPFGRQYWFQDNYGRQYINRDSNNVEFAIRVRKNGSKSYLSIARNDRCLIFNDVGEGYMTSNTACESLEFKATPPWNQTWNDPLAWKNCVEDHIKQDKDDGKGEVAASSRDIENLRWAVCRIKCAEDHSQSQCKICEAVGYY